MQKLNSVRNYSHSSKRRLWSSMLLGTAAIASALCAHGGFASQSPPAKNEIENAVRLYVTSRGQSYFGSNFQHLLFQNGLDFSEAAIEDWSYEAAEPLNLDKLPSKFQQFKGTLGDLRETLKSWLLGFKLNDPKFAVDVRGIQYKLELAHLGIRADYEALRKGKNAHGVVLVVEAEIPKLKVEASEIRGKDLNNKFLGVFGLNGFHAEVKATRPLKVQIPFHLEIDRDGALHVSTLGLKTNINAIEMSAGFARPLVLPKVQLVINDQVMTLDHAAVENALIKKQADLLKALQHYLKDYSEQKGPAVIDTVLARYQGRHLQDVSSMDPMGATSKVKPEDKFLWSLKLAEVEQDSKFLTVGLSSSVEDQKKRVNPPIEGAEISREAPTLDQLDTSQYDLALTINKGLINRILQLSYARGYLVRIDCGDGKPVKFNSAPLLKVTQKKDRVRFYLVVEQPIESYRKIAVKGPIEVRFELEARIESNGKGGLRMVVDHIDESTAFIDPKYVRADWDWLEKVVLNSAKDDMRERNKKYAKVPNVLSEELPIPHELFGVPLQVQDFDFEESGHLVVYMRYGK